MTKQVIDIGVQGNDGTGDSIRESFRKVNENFDEIYAIFGASGTISFSRLHDGVVYNENQLIMGNSTGSSLSARDLIAGVGIEIDQSDTELTISASAANLQSDHTPSLSGPLNASGVTIGNLRYPSEEAVNDYNAVWAPNTTTIEQLPATVGYANETFVAKTSDGIVGTITTDGILSLIHI